MENESKVTTEARNERGGNHTNAPSYLGSPHWYLMYYGFGPFLVCTTGLLISRVIDMTREETNFEE